VVSFILVALGAALAAGMEMLEALAIVVAVGVTRRWDDAVLGAVAAIVVCLVVGVAAAPVLSAIPLDALRLTIGALLLCFGLEWLRKATLRLAGRRARSSSLKEYFETREELADVPLPPAGQADWAGRAVAFKGVLLEGVEVALIVTTLAARPGGAAPAIAGAAVALLVVLAAAGALRRPLERIPETELKWGVGVLLSAFGVFFAAEGMHVHWPGGDAALLYLAATLALASQLHSHALARGGTRAPA
jgi:uncharacterized membrane protein